jgi:hypothetical protein
VVFCIWASILIKIFFDLYKKNNIFRRIGNIFIINFFKKDVKKQMDKNENPICTDCSNHESPKNHHHSSLSGELACHLPYAVFATAACLIILSFLGFIGAGKDIDKLNCFYDQLFHNFHFLHIVFASIGTLITFFRFSKNVFKGMIVGFISASFFCILSDIVLPYIGGTLLGVQMHLHVCFYYELQNVLPFLFIGLFTGLIMRNHQPAAKGHFSLWSHSAHIFISALASSFYLVSHGFYDWMSQIGFVFLVLIIAVVLPCTLSDIIVPMIFARTDKEK